MKCQKSLGTTVCAGLLALVIAVPLHAQKDPGPRPGAAGAGGYYPPLSPSEQALFNAGLSKFSEVNGVVRANGSGGLGPGYNSNSCESCHAQPASLGTSPSPQSVQNPGPNPEIAAA